MDYSVLKRRYAGLDIFRIAAALTVCMYHTALHLECDYGFLQNFAVMGNVLMTGFFLLSGFSLFVNWGGTQLTDKQIVKQFYLKRLIGIVPMYWFVSLLFDVMVMVMNIQPLSTTLILAPVEALGLQMVFHSLRNFSHNGGTWFISCLLVCYAVYPLLQGIVCNLSLRQRIALIIVSVAILLYAPFVVDTFEVETIYRNPFFRMLEFTIGVLLASLKVDLDQNKYVRRYMYNWYFVLIVAALMVLGVSLGVEREFQVGNVMLYNILCLPCFLLILLGLSGMEFQRLRESKVLKQLSGITYVFFLAQLFSDSLSKRVIAYFGVNQNPVRILIGWSVTIIIAVGFRIVELWISRQIHKRMG